MVLQHRAAKQYFIPAIGPPRASSDTWCKIFFGAKEQDMDSSSRVKGALGSGYISLKPFAAVRASLLSRAYRRGTEVKRTQRIARGRGVALGCVFSFSFSRVRLRTDLLYRCITGLCAARRPYTTTPLFYMAKNITQGPSTKDLPARRSVRCRLSCRRFQRALVAASKSRRRLCERSEAAFESTPLNEPNKRR